MKMDQIGFSEIQDPFLELFEPLSLASHNWDRKKLLPLFLCHIGYKTLLTSFYFYFEDKGVPHFIQNLSPGLASVLHFGHRGGKTSVSFFSKLVPQEKQNLAMEGLKVPHLGQEISGLVTTVGASILVRVGTPLIISKAGLRD